MQKLTVVAFASLKCINLLPRLIILSKLRQRLPRRNAFTKFLSPEAVYSIVFIGLTGTMLTEEACGSLVSALRYLTPHDAAEEPETLEVRVLRVQMSESR